MKKILVLLNSSGAAITSRKEVLEAIKNSGYDVTISAPYDEYTEQIITSGFHYIKTEMDSRGSNPIRDFKLLLFYIRLIIDERPDLVLTYTIKPNVYGGIASRICRRPQFANITGLSDAIHKPGKMRTITTWLYRLGLRKTKIVFFQNVGDKDYCISNKIGNNKYILLPGSGVNLTEFYFSKYLTEGSTKFLFIGRLKKDKGIEEFLEMIQVIKKRHPEVEFHILGDYNQNYAELVEQLIANKTLLYHGKTKDVRPFILNCHCLILPSYHEGMSNVLLESCAMGRPIITTNVHGCMEAVDNGINGYCVNVRDSKSLIDGVERFVNLPYPEKVNMGLKARLKVEKEFDRNIISNIYIDEIANILKA
jgi:Glycosyltransferase